MISEREKKRRFEVAVKIAKENLPEPICGVAIWSLEHGFMQGKPVVIFSKHGSLLFGEQELKVIASGDTAVESCVQYGITDDDWNSTDALEFLETCRQCIYLQAPNLTSANRPHSEWWKELGISNLDDLEK